MANFSEEFINAVAHGDKEATGIANNLSSLEKITLGMVVNEKRERESIIPMDNGFSVYERQKSSYVDDEAVAKSMAERIQAEKDNEAKKAKDREEWLEKVAKQEVERARARLTSSFR